GSATLHVTIWSHIVAAWTTTRSSRHWPTPPGGTCSTGCTSATGPRPRSSSPVCRGRRPHALGALVGVGDVPLRRDEAPARAGGRGPRRRPPLGPGEAALP